MLLNDYQYQPPYTDRKQTKRGWGDYIVHSHNKNIYIFFTFLSHFNFENSDLSNIYVYALKARRFPYLARKNGGEYLKHLRSV